MKKTILSSIVVAFSLVANAGHMQGNNLPVEKAEQVVHAGLNVVINAGNLVVSFGENAVKAFPAAYETAADLVKCFNNNMTGMNGGTVTAPVVCPIQIGTEAAAAIILKGVSGVQEVIAVPSKFAKDIAAIMLDTSKRSWDSMEQYAHVPGFFVVQLGVAVASQAIGRVAQGAAWAVDFVSDVAGKAIELVVNGVKTGIKYALDAVVILADAVVGRVKIVGRDAYGAAKSVVITLVKAAHGDIGGNDGAIKNFLDNVVGRLVTLPFRLIMNESWEEMQARTENTCDQSIYEATGECIKVSVK